MPPEADLPRADPTPRLRPAPAAPLVRVLNEAADAADALAEDVTPATLRRLAHDALAGRFGFPLAAVVRGLVVGERDVDGRVLEVAPEGVTPEALALVGPLLVPLARPLGAGSVLVAEVELVDPASYELQPAGLLCRLAALRVEVAVEP